MYGADFRPHYCGWRRRELDLEHIRGQVAELLQRLIGSVLDLRIEIVEGRSAHDAEAWLSFRDEGFRIKVNRPIDGRRVQLVVTGNSLKQQRGIDNVAAEW